MKNSQLTAPGKVSHIFILGISTIFQLHVTVSLHVKQVRKHTINTRIHLLGFHLGIRGTLLIIRIASANLKTGNDLFSIYTTEMQQSYKHNMLHFFHCNLCFVNTCFPVKSASSVAHSIYVV